MALTGTIGSGKTTVGAMFRALGAYTLDADELARAVVAKGAPALDEIVKVFGSDILLSDGTLDRKKLGKVVFADPAKRIILEGITHPAIRKLAAERFQQALQTGYPLYIYECPLLFETNLDKMPFKKIILVKASEEICRERIIRREGISAEEANQRINAQFSPAIKEQQAHIIIENSSTLEALKNQVTELFLKLKTACSGSAA